MNTVIAIRRKYLNTFGGGILSFSSRNLSNVIHVFRVKTGPFNVLRMVGRRLLMIRAFRPMGFFRGRIFLLRIMFRFLHGSFFVRGITRASASTISLIHVTQPSPIFHHPRLPTTFSRFFYLIRASVMKGCSLHANKGLRVLHVSSLNLRLFRFLGRAFQIGGGTHASSASNAQVRGTTQRGTRQVDFTTNRGHVSHIVPSLKASGSVHFYYRMVCGLSFPLVTPLNTGSRDYYRCAFSFLLVVR